MSDLGGFLRNARGRRSIEVMAAEMGVNKNTLGGYERGERLPDVDFLAAFSLRTGESFARLLWARLKDVDDGKLLAALEAQGTRLNPDRASLVDAVLEGPRVAVRSGPRAGLDAAQASRSIPVIGLAECGLKGWYQNDAMAVRAACPSDLADHDAFAVIAIGSSLVPEGIRPGYLCICSPAARAGAGDAVYVEQADGTASLKIFVADGGGWVELRGYLPPEESGVQMLYTERLRRDRIARLAPVVYVKRRL